MNEIVSLYIKGASVPSIMKSTGLRRVDVLEYLDEYKQIAANDPEIQGRARETLHNFDLHTSDIVRELWELHNGSDDEKIRLQALKHLADIDKARVETLQKAGLYDDAALGDEMVKVQEQANQIKDLLKDVVTEFPATKDLILKGLNKIFNESNGVTIVVPPTEGGETPAA
jgi:hypothetical protein